MIMRGIGHCRPSTSARGEPGEGPGSAGETAALPPARGGNPSTAAQTSKAELPPPDPRGGSLFRPDRSTSTRRVAFSKAFGRRGGTARGLLEASTAFFWTKTAPSHPPEGDQSAPVPSRKPPTYAPFSRSFAKTVFLLEKKRRTRDPNLPHGTVFGSPPSDSVERSGSPPPNEVFGDASGSLFRPDRSTSPRRLAPWVALGSKFDPG